MKKDRIDNNIEVIKPNKYQGRLFMMQNLLKKFNLLKALSTKDGGFFYGRINIFSKICFLKLMKGDIYEYFTNN